MPCPTEAELNAQVHYPQKLYPQQLPNQVMNQAGDCYRLIPCAPPSPVVQQCQKLVRVRVLRACGGQWSLMQELTLNSPPAVGTSIVLEGGSYKIESLLLLGNSDGYDSYEALVIPALQGSYQVGPWGNKGGDCGCAPVKPIQKTCGCSGGCGCSSNNCGSPCVSVPYPVYALRGYPW